MKLISSLTRRYLSFVVFFNLLLFSKLTAQSQSVCPIGVGTEPKKNTELRPGALFNEIRFGLSPAWSNLSHMKFSDNKKAEMTLNGIIRSRQIIGNNFKFQIPEGATINGIMLMVEGSSKNYKNIDELEIFLVGKDGEPKGQNKNNEAKLQKAWSKKSDGEDHSWMYGSGKDTWGTAWTPDEINDPNFGFQIQVRNIDNSINSVAIDQVTILVDYTPAYSFCDDNCLTFYIDKYDKYGSYVWIPPSGFRLVSHTFNHQTIDLKVNEASYGLYNICVNVYDKTGKFVEKCCRNFLYQDCKSSEMEGIVWSDLNDNDIRDAEDRIIAGSPVYLYTKDHKPVDTVLTDAYGKYRFVMAESGVYYIKVPAVTDKKFVLFSNLDPDNNSDITNAFGPGTTDLIHVEIGRRYEGIDLGYKPVVTIGNYVWEDNNYNGLQDEDELGLSGIKIFLLKQNLTIVDSVVSDQNGLYRFANVNANKYRVKFSTLSGFRSTWFNNSDNEKNSKVDSTGITGLLTFIDSGSRLNIDAGYYKPATIGDLVWEDKNGNGLIDVDESGVPNIKLTLTGLAGDGQRLNKDVFSSNDGKYYFSSLPPGKYDITVQPGDDYVFTTVNAGADNIDSDVVNGKIADITLKSGDSLLNFDAGIYMYAKVGDYVWDDKNANGIQDVGESGIPGISITLSQIQNNIKVPVKTFTTSQDGFYLFDSLMPGRYFITIQKPEEFNLTPLKIGIDETKDSDYAENEGISIILMSGEENSDADIGLFRLGKVGNFVWEDKNANGIQDIGEFGIPGIKVILAGRDYLKDTLTDANGLYLFEKLKPGKYQLSLNASSDIYVFTLPNIGINDAKDSDVVNGSIPAFTIDGGQTDLSRDFGLVKYLEIGDYIWEDQDADGIQDANELPIAGIEVKLRGTSFEKNVIDLKVTSDAQGKYLFNKVLPGKYDLSISIPSAYTPTKFSKGENRNLDSNLPENGRPFTIEIAESVDDRSIDFGLIRLGNIGDLVWEDLNCDKQRQLNEPGLAGVSVVLSGRDIFDNEVNSLQVTDALGHYNFSSLKPGTYTVTITTPQGFESTESLVRVITISSGSLIENIDIPFFKRTSVGDFVWDDVNGNGIQDTGELGISGVSVTLSGVSDAIFAPVATTTNVSGQYKFDNLKPGVYTLRFGDIADYRFADRKAGNEVTKDSDVDNSGVTGNIDLVSGSPRTDVDAGYVSTSTASVSDFVWEDLNGDGLQDTGEPGISGVTVTLDGMSTSGKNITKSVVTDGGGKYKIDSLPEGQYRVTFSSFTGYFFTKSLGIEESRNSDANEVTGQTSVINLQKGQRLETIDAGLYRRTSVGDFVWDDVNGNGIQDTGELGLSGVSVTLSGVSDATFASVTTTTNVSGQYKFENLKPGVYTLRFGDIADYRFADRKAGNEVTKDSDVDNSGVTGNIDLVSGSPRTDVDAGYVSTSIGSVSDFVWEDLNGDGLQDTGEPGISGVTVTLDGMSTSGKNITKSVVTDGGGKYKIDSLPDGQYRVTFSILPGYFFTKSLGIEESRNSDANEVTGQTSVINLQKGQRLETIDAGLYRRTSVGDFVWDDVNGNGIQDTGELGISGVSVTLSGVSDVTFASVTTTTNVTGHYKFENLKPGVYTLRFGDIADYRFADRKAGNEVTKDSDVDNSGVTGNIDLVSGSPRTDIDAGYVSTSIGSVSDFVWEDLNGDGLQDTGEPGISGVTVTLDGMSTSGKNITKSVVTDGGGKYKIDSLPDGQYRVTFSILPGYFFTKSIGIEESRNSDANEVTGQTSVINLQKGQRLETIDAGLYRRTSVGDFVWDDVNGNGIQDTGELGLSGVSVTLSGVSDATFASVTTTTNVSGQYKFENLKPGVYNIVFGQVALKNLTSPKVGADDGKDSDPVLGGHVSNVTLVSGVHRNDIDAGYVPISTASIRGFVWEDLNANGVQDAGEPGISNDTVSLKREDGNFSGGLVTVISDQNGRYIFSNLAAGSYTVIFGRPSGFEFTDNDRGDDAFDSDALAPAGKTSVFTIGSGQSLLNIDAGLFRRGSLGDFVWNDSNGNGLQEASESGLSGIMLTLKDETNSVIGSTNSDINGKYLFSNIKPAKYKIEAVLPKGYTSVPINPQDLTLNSDFYPSDSLANTALITVLSGIQNLDIDLGIVIKSRISGIVWKDSIGNGLREEIEPMMGSVVVILLNSTGSELKRDTTDSNGAYLFKDIEAGTYKVKFAIMPGMFFTYPNVGSNDSKSSDVIDQSGVTSEFLVMEGLDMANVCAGYVNSSSIGDYIWIDENKNGLQSSDEVGLNGVKIYLLNQLGIVIDSTTSNISNSGSGYYSFSNLIYGQYSVKFSLPANFDFTMLNSSDTLLNSDIVDAATGKTSTLTLLPGQMRKDVDAGYTLKAAVTGTINGIVWQDNNNNKFRDGADSLLSGITVSLFKRDRTLVATTLSGPDGSYLFSQVAFGDYFVSVPSISEKMFVLKQGNPVQNGSQISNFFGAGSTDLISVLPGSTVSGIDLGYSRKITIGDFVWDDLNNNGLQDTNEPGIGNIIISLINEAGVIEKTTTSNDSGQYTISDIGPGRYKIKFSSKSDYVFAKLNSTDDGKNSKVNPTNGETPLLDFLTLITYTNIDAGYTKAGSVGSRVWLDLNGNGIFQSNEPGIPDIKIKLYSEDGSLADSTTTGQDGTSLFSGFYTFSKVRPGKYYIKFEIPLTYIISVPDVGGDEDVDCDITATFGPMTTDLFEVSGHQFVKNIDAGAYRPATIGDRVWNDLNMNGIQESGEPGVANVKVSLYNQSGILLDTTRTNGQGIYSFMNLRQRLYYLQFSLPDGFQFTIQNAPGTNEDDSDVDNTGTTPLISLAHGSNLLQIDAGIFRSSARIVMGKVWKDGNEDGICNTGETYETGVKVYLKDLATGEVKSSITNHAGRYALITNNVGEHHVVVEAPEDFVFTEKGMGNDNESDSDVNELGISDVLMLTDQYAMKYIDAGYYYKVVSSLNGKVWKDKNNNGLRDDTDSLMQNVVVFLFDKSRIFVKSTKTNSAGEYSFKFLDAGQYYCRIPEFSDMSFVMFTGNNQEKDSEITNQFGVGTSRLITIDPGTPFNNFDFGYVDLNRLVVSDPKRIVQYEVFPNPVINEIRVKVPLDILMKTQYNIINNVGMVVKSGTIDGESEILETGHLPSGRYVIQFFNEKEMILKTFIKVDN